MKTEELLATKDQNKEIIRINNELKEIKKGLLLNIRNILHEYSLDKKSFKEQKREQKKIMSNIVMDMRKKQADRNSQIYNTKMLFQLILKKFSEELYKNNNQEWYSLNLVSHDKEGLLNPFFKENFIDLNLLHSLCYQNHIILFIGLNHQCGTANMNFILDPNNCYGQVTRNQINANNYAYIDYFYENYAKNYREPRNRRSERTKKHM